MNDRPSAFDLEVEQHFDIPQHGLIVIARLRSGLAPPKGLAVLVRAQSRPDVATSIDYWPGSEIWHARQRGTLDESQHVLLFRHLGKQDVPIGAHILPDPTALQPATSTPPSKV